jgi:hypothetical protein
MSAACVVILYLISNFSRTAFTFISAELIANKFIRVATIKEIIKIPAIAEIMMNVRPKIVLRNTSP